MELAKTGLGKMGFSMATRLAKDGHRVVVFARTAKMVEAVENNGVEGAHSFEEAAGKLKAPRACWKPCATNSVITL